MKAVTSWGWVRQASPSVVGRCSRWCVLVLCVAVALVALDGLAAVHSVATAQATEAVPSDDEGGEPLIVRGLRSRCGGDTRGVEARQARVTGVPSGPGRVRVRIRNLSSYCAPAPMFRAERRGAELRLTLQWPTPGTPVARCTCYHNIRLTLVGVPPGGYQLVVEGTDVEPVRRDGRWVNAPITYETTVQVRGRARRAR